MARLHFAQIRRGATKNFNQWVAKRFDRLKVFIKEEDDHAHHNDNQVKQDYENYHLKIKMLRSTLSAEKFKASNTDDDHLKARESQFGLSGKNS